MKPIELYNTLLAQKIIDELEKRNIAGIYCETKEDALRRILEMIPDGSTVSCGGSVSLHEIGLQDALKKAGYDFLDPNSVQGAAAKDGIAHQALAADYYIMSTNAITTEGELVNMDGYGNRAAALIFGPKNVIVIAGMNKVEPNLDTAILRVKNYAAPLVLLRLKQDYSSFDELAKAAEGAGCHLVVTGRTAANRIKVVLVGESLGY